MWLKLVCVVAITSGALGADVLLEMLYGAQARNRVAVCVLSAGGRWRRCDGALYSGDCVVARAQCLATAPSNRMAVVRVAGPASCEHLTADTYSLKHRNVHTHLMHPYLNWAIVVVEFPYINLDHLHNATSVRRNLRRHRVYKWMKYHINTYAQYRDHGYHINRIARQMKTYKHPIFFFFTTMVLPSVLFMVFFIYVIFYTGSSQEVPYNKLQKTYSKRVTQI